MPDGHYIAHHDHVAEPSNGSVGWLSDEPMLTRKQVRPEYLLFPGEDPDALRTVGPRTPYKHEIPRDLVPDLVDMDANFSDRDDLIAASVAVGDQVRFPALAGLRAVLPSWRAERAQNKLKRLAEEQEVMNFIGESVLNGTGYLSLSHDDLPKSAVRSFKLPDGTEVEHKIVRPHRLLEKGQGERLARINKRRIRNRLAAERMVMVYPEVEGTKQSLSPINGQKSKLFFDEYDKGSGGSLERSWGERKSMGVTARKYRNNQRMTNLHDRMFRHIVTKPSREAKGLEKKRDRLTKKATALRMQADTNRLTRGQRKDRAKDKASDLWSGTKKGVKAGSVRTAKAAGSTLSGARKRVTKAAKKLRK